MAVRLNRTVAMINYILTPEFSSKPEQDTAVLRNLSSPQWRLIGNVKTSAWILLSIILSLALGQLK